MEQQHFFERVESMRGLAALCVAIYHGQLVFSLPGADPLYLTGLTETLSLPTALAVLLLVPFNGQGAVALFFVISGFVLGLSLDRRPNSLLKEGLHFILRRALRIYPIFIGSLLVIAATVFLISPAPPYLGTSQWFNTWYRQPFSIDNVVTNLMFLDTGLNNVTWTLRVELEVALLFPTLYLLSRRVPPLVDVLVMGGFTVLCITMPTPSSLKWLLAFYAGLMLPRWGPWMAAAVHQSPVGAGPWVVGMLLLWGAARPLCLRTSVEWAIPIVETLSGAVLLAFVVHLSDRHWLAWLDTAVIRKLGQISYSFYVLNFIVLYLWGLLFVAVIPLEMLVSVPLAWNCVISLIACLSSFPIAALSYHWIEKPFIEVGRRLTGGRVRPESTINLARAA